MVFTILLYVIVFFLFVHVYMYIVFVFTAIEIDNICKNMELLTPRTYFHSKIYVEYRHTRVILF